MQDEALRQARILIVDDQAVNLLPLDYTLRKHGFRDIITITDPREVLTTFRDIQPDIILLDLNMPYMDGFEVLEQLSPLIDDSNYLPIFVLTADLTPHVKHRALATQINDFLTKPFDPLEAFLRIKKLLETRYHHQVLQNQNRQLMDDVQERTREFDESQVETLSRLAHAAEYRDDLNGEHTNRVADLSALLAQAMGMPDAEVELVQHAAMAHDIGKIGIPDYILLKPDKLTPEEYEVVKAHTTLGARLLSEGHSDLVRLAQQIARSHHERWDGSGYPEGLCGENIPQAGRIVAVAEFFETLLHDRPYKKPLPADQARAEVERLSGTWFDPEVVAALVRVMATPAPRPVEQVSAR